MNSCCLPPSVGPPGSRGPAGPTGPVGPQGPPGEIGGIALSAAGGLISSGTASFANANGVSFGVVGQTVTASVAAAVGGGIGLSAGTQSVSTGTVVFSNSNGLTFGMSGSSRITGSFSTLSFANSNGVTFGTAGSTVTASYSTLSFANSNGVTFGTAGSTVTASVAAAGGVAASYYDNMVTGISNSVSAMGTLNFAGAQNSLRLAPLQAQGFPLNITAGTFMLDMFLSGSTATMSLPFTSSFSVGIYTSNGGSLSLLNSCSVSFGFGVGDLSNSTAFAGQRFLTIHSSLWSSSPVFVAGSQYWIATNFATSVLSNQTGSLFGQIIYSTGQRQGSIGVAEATAGTHGWAPFYGLYSTSTAAMPTSIANSELNKTALGARGFVPHVVMVNHTGLSVF